MKKTVVYISMSLDGYLADENSSVEWLVGDGSDEKNPGSYEQFFENVDVVILGSKTYKQISQELSPEVWVYKGAKTYVLTSNTSYKDDLENEIYFVSDKIDDLIISIREESRSNKDIWIAGGAGLVNSFIASDLVDSYRVAIIPILLGDGIRLFNKMDKRHELKLISSRTYNGMVELEYENR